VLLDDGDTPFQTELTLESKLLDRVGDLEGVIPTASSRIRDFSFSLSLARRLLRVGR
jgi:hypothetical protein